MRSLKAWDTPGLKGFKSRENFLKRFAEWSKASRSAAHSTGMKRRWRFCHEENACSAVADEFGGIRPEFKIGSDATVVAQRKRSSDVQSKVRYERGHVRRRSPSGLGSKRRRPFLQPRKERLLR